MPDRFISSASSAPAAGACLVSAIVRSSGDASRRSSFRRAVRSILDQQGVNVECIVVFNGDAIDEEMLEWARAQPNTRCKVLNKRNKPRATLLGRDLVRGNFFCFLDDDDEFLPGAFAFSAEILANSPSLDCVATNGFYITPDGVKCVFNETERYELDGYAESLLLSHNWLASCGGMFRSSTVPPKYFADLPRHREWTVIAFRLACDLRVQFVNKLAYRVYSSPESQSKGHTYIEGAVDALNAMLHWTQNPVYENALRQRISEAYHDIASYYRIRAQFAKAWQAYLLSVRWGGLRFVPYAALLIARETRSVEQLVKSLPLFGRRRHVRHVAVSGLPLFCSRLARQLQRRSSEWKLHVIESKSKPGVIRSAFIVAGCDIWYSIGEPVSDRRLEWLARMLNKRRVVHWVGSDLAVLQDASARKALSARRVRHLVEVQWMADKTRKAGLRPTMVPLPPNWIPQVLPPLPRAFTVLLYVPRTRGDFYGARVFEQMMAALAHLPIEYIIVGGGQINVPENVRVTNLGWRENLIDVYRDTSVLVRFTQHDGLSLMVLEALAAGRHVLWTQDFPYCRTVASAADVQRETELLFERFTRGDLELQSDAAKMIRDHYSESTCVNRLVSAWKLSYGR